MLLISRPSEQKRHKSLHGLYRSLINNCVIGVSEGYELSLELVGVGYKVSLQGNVLNLSLGFSHSIYFEIPNGFEVQIRPRSGLAAKNSITVLNSPGTIDADYRGEVKVILINHGLEMFEVEDKMRIAQMVVSKYEKVNFELVSDLSESERGSGGFGSTGTK